MRTLSLLAGLMAVTVLGLPTAAADDTVDLQALIDATPPGGTIVLDQGHYRGGVLIDQPLTITGVGWPTVDGGGDGTVIEVTSPDVTIEGLVITGSGITLDREDSGLSVTGARAVIRNNRFEDVLFGAFLRSAPDSVISDNVFGSKDVFIANRGDGIRLWESERSVIENNVVRGGRDTVFWFTDEITVRGNEVSDGRYGLHFMYSDGAVVEENVLSNNSVGAFIMYSRDVVIRNNVLAENHGPSGYGIGLKDMDRVELVGNRVIGNRVGIYFDNTPYAHDEYGYTSGNLIAYNRTGVLLQPSVKRNVFHENAFIDNGEQVGLTGTGSFQGNAWSLDGVGNYWSDFAGYDANGDGIGDVAYKVDDLYNTLTDSHPDLEFFQNTPAARAMSLSADLFPILRPDPLVEDPHPMVARPQFGSLGRGGGAGARIAMLAVSALMIGTAAALMLAPRRARTHPANRKAHA
ncbi:MAG: nitrous oxide reductase family maturation protein NosD [Acidimicrobiia bacterium]|nr:nitrous oxide reductase family maturation protein NosD [Acidimicrobiia bacterium]